MPALGSVGTVVLYNAGCDELCGQTQIPYEIYVELIFFPRAAVIIGIFKSRFSEYRNYLYIVCLILHSLDQLIDIQSNFSLNQIKRA